MGKVVRATFAGRTTAVPNNAPEDAALVEAARAGSRAAFGTLVDRYKILVFSTAYSRTGSASLSEDIAQECFVEAWRDLPRLRDPACFRSWICRIARRVGYRYEQKQDRFIHDIAETTPSFSGDLPSADPSPLDRMITQEEATVVWKTLARLPDEYRMPLVLYYQDGRSLQKVAAALDLTEASVKSRLHRGRQMLNHRIFVMLESALKRMVVIRRDFTGRVIAAISLGAGSGSAASGQRASRSVGSKGLIAAAVLGTALTALFGARHLLSGIECRGRVPAKAGRSAPGAPPPPQLVASVSATDAPMGLGGETPPSAELAAASILSFDFEEGTTPDNLFLGQVVPGPARSGSRYAAAATATASFALPVDQWTAAVALEARGLHFRDTLLLAFDYWTGISNTEIFVEVWNDDRKSNYQRAFTPNVRPNRPSWNGSIHENVVPGRWGHLVVPVSMLLPAKPVGPMEPGDRLAKISIYTLQSPGEPFFVDNLTVTEVPR